MASSSKGLRCPGSCLRHIPCAGTSCACGRYLSPGYQDHLRADRHRGHFVAVIRLRVQQGGLDLSLFPRRRVRPMRLAEVLLEPGAGLAPVHRGRDRSRREHRSHTGDEELQRRHGGPPDDDRLRTKRDAHRSQRQHLLHRLREPGRLSVPIGFRRMGRLPESEDLHVAEPWATHLLGQGGGCCRQRRPESGDSRVGAHGWRRGKLSIDIDHLSHLACRLLAPL